MKLADLLERLRGNAPESLAEPWDNVGLLVGDTGQAVRNAMLCVDLTEAVLAEAIARRAELVVAYHPLIFEPIRRLVSDDPRQKIVLAAARRGIAVYTPHTALDSAPGGVNDWLATGLGPGKVSPIRPAAGGGPARFKVVTFIPPDAAAGLRDALSAAGAGHIGNYSDCSFNMEGVGTFKGAAATRPAVGRRGHLERVSETRIEMVCGADRLSPVIEALRRAHPYEEPAFDLHRLEPPPARGFEGAGQGRLVVLDRPVRLRTLADRIRKHLGQSHLRLATPRTGPARPIQRIGLCAGAGGSLLDEADGVDAFFTGEMGHHHVLAAVARDIAVVLAGHSQTERPFLPHYRKKLARACGAQVKWHISRTDRPPLVALR